jgi:hypothetical protein
MDPLVAMDAQLLTYLQVSALRVRHTQVLFHQIQVIERLQQELNEIGNRIIAKPEYDWLYQDILDAAATHVDRQLADAKLATQLAILEENVATVLCNVKAQEAEIEMGNIFLQQ